MISLNIHLPEKYTTVTRLSKIIALILFIALPFTGFYLGEKYAINYILPFEKLKSCNVAFPNKIIIKENQEIIPNSVSFKSTNNVPELSYACINNKVLTNIVVNKKNFSVEQPQLNYSCNENDVWVTYKNDSMRYSMSYPEKQFTRYICKGEDLRLVLRKSNDTAAVSERYLGNCDRDSLYAVEVESRDTPFNTLEDNSDYTVKKQNILIDGKTPAVKLRTTYNEPQEVQESNISPDLMGMPPQTNPDTSVLFQRNGKYYRFYFGLEDEVLIDKMISSIKLY